MTATSDLDLIVVYDFDGEEPESNGKRPLYGAQYFARFTQRLISALAVQTNYGILFYQLLIFMVSIDANPRLTLAEKLRLRRKRPDLEGTDLLPLTLKT